MRYCRKLHDIQGNHRHRSLAQATHTYAGCESSSQPLLGLRLTAPDCIQYVLDTRYMQARLFYIDYDKIDTTVKSFVVQKLMALPRTYLHLNRSFFLVRAWHPYTIPLSTCCHLDFRKYPSHAYYPKPIPL